ncbi:dihydropteroate synthase [Treponema sp. TIM-1]|uniref:dihydropteroate synthase n=1 Tax=Treponema sp. TIM-1 TaxID=2898417 RepID=UPI00397F1023
MSNTIPGTIKMTGPVKLPGGGALDLSGKPLVMAIVNCTEDSFYPGSHNAGPEAAVERALVAAEAGADIIDFGGESTRPGAAYVSEEEEQRRLIPVIRAFRRQKQTPISVDTRKEPVARAALEAGANLINDISALEDDPALGPRCAEWGAPVVLMHKKGIPTDMQDQPYYEDVVGEVRSYLAAAVARALAVGIPPEHIILDPGIGFGKRREDNLALLTRLDEIRALGYPVLIGLSRKTIIGDLTGREVSQRLAGTLAANALCLMKGARIIRVHDVPEAVDLVKVLSAIGPYPAG